MSLYDLEQVILALQVRERIRALPSKQRRTLELKLQGLNFKEIATVMDCAYDTAKANYRHAVLKLRVTTNER